MNKNLTAVLAAVVALGGLSTAAGAAKVEKGWDKTFAKSAKVNHQKVEFKNRYGITLTGDLYLPKDRGDRRLAALAVSGPFGAVKEQSSGLYAQTMAERGFAALAFDPSFTGESGGEPRNVASPDINTEDFSAAVDYLGTRAFVDRERIGAIGICGFGGMALNAAAADKRIKAVVTTSMYDMSRTMAKGINDSLTPEQRAQMLEKLGGQRWADFEKGVTAPGPRILPEALAADSDPVTREFFDYYRTPRGFHKNSANSNGAWTATTPLSFMNMPLLTYIKEISPRPILLIAGEKAHSRYFSEDAYKLAAEPKELMIIPGANHVDLYDNAKVIPFDKITEFFAKNLNHGGAMEQAKRIEIFQKGEKGPGDMFTGTTWVRMLVTDKDKTYDTQSYNVVFEPGARTFWHSHPGGQLLFVTSGKGFYQEKGKPARLLLKGDVVEIPLNTVHWHGAAADEEFVHLGVSARTDKGPAKWHGAVTDEEYSEAIKDR